jgi:hypothetical protein
VRSAEARTHESRPSRGRSPPGSRLNPWCAALGRVTDTAPGAQPQVVRVQ